ncbi:MAG: 4-hydroxybenzoate octaprenyltransferase [Methylococcales bacterium]|nr:4-hydroxybenzoate octaprenyltransferase [Methylococcales bacterium]
MMQKKLHAYLHLTRFDKPVGIYLLLWPTLWALWLAANGVPDGKILGVFVAGVVLMRAAGCAINDYFDRHIDGHVKRTQNRPLAQGLIHPREAVAVFIGLALLAFALVLLLNPFTVALSFVGAALAACYPLMKRKTHLPQAFLGMAFGWAVPMAFAAQTNNLPPLAWVVYLAVILWALIYDTLYALADKADDIKIGVKSTAILFGRQVRLMVGILQAVMLGLLIVAGNMAALGVAYWLGLVVAAGLFGYHQYLIKDQKPSLCFQAFKHNHWVGLAILIGIMLALA